MRIYEVLYSIEINGKETHHKMSVTTSSAKCACEYCKKVIRETTGRHVYNLTARKIRTFDAYHGHP